MWACIMSIICKEFISSWHIALLLQQRFFLYVGRADSIVCQFYIIVFYMQNSIFCIGIYLLSMFSKTVISARVDKRLLLCFQNLNSMTLHLASAALLRSIFRFCPGTFSLYFMFFSAFLAFNAAILVKTCASHRFNSNRQLFFVWISSIFNSNWKENVKTYMP